MPNESHSKFININGDSFPSFSIINKWAVKFKRVAVPALKMFHVKDVQKVQQHRKSLNKCMICYWMIGG
jgi:hypothetical protein